MRVRKLLALGWRHARAGPRRRLRRRRRRRRRHAGGEQQLAEQAGGARSRSASCPTARATFGSFFEPTASGFNLALIDARRRQGRRREADATASTGATIAGKNDRDRRLRLRRRHRRQGDRGDAPPDGAGGRRHPRRPALRRRGHRGRELRQGASGQDVHQRHRGRAGRDAQGAGAELLPLPPGRRAVVGRPGRLRLQRAGLEDGRDHRRRLLVPVHVAGRLRGRVLRDRRQHHQARVGAAGREGLLVLHLADPEGRRRPLRRHRRLGPDLLHQAVQAAERQGRHRADDGQRLLGRPARAQGGRQGPGRRHDVGDDRGRRRLARGQGVHRRPQDVLRRRDRRRGPVGVHVRLLHGRPRAGQGPRGGQRRRRRPERSSRRRWPA